MDYRSPTIHSSVLKMAGSPFSRTMTGNLSKTNGDPNGNNEPRYRYRHHGAAIVALLTRSFSGEK